MSKQISSEVQQHCAFVQGKYNKNPLPQNSVHLEQKKMGKNNSFRRKKPIVGGKFDGAQAELFLDSASEVNVIDENFLLKILTVNPTECRKM